MIARNVVMTAIVASAVAFLFVQCKSPYGDDTPAADGGGAGSSSGAVDSASDVVPVVTDASGGDARTDASDTPVTPSPLDGGSECFDLVAGDQGFLITNGLRSSEGVTLALDSTHKGFMVKTVTTSMTTAVSAITKSVVAMQGSFALSPGGAWDASAYADLFGEYLGLTASYNSSPAVELELQASTCDVNIWSAPGHFAGTHTLQTAGVLNNARMFTVTTDWKSGDTTLIVDGLSQTIPGASSISSTSNALTIRIGGGVMGGTTPVLKFTVQQVCITLN